MSEKTVKVGVLCIQGAFIEHIHMLQRVAEGRNDRTKVSVIDVRKPSQIPDLDGLIIPGGESTTLGVFLRKNHFQETLRAWMFSKERPGVVWGTCAGLILLSEELHGQKQGGQVVLGGLDVDCIRNIYGRQVSSFEGTVRLKEPSLCRDTDSPSQSRDEFHGIFIRAPGVAAVNSPSVKVLATLDDAENSVVAVQQNNLMATCFHPELTNDVRWHSYFVNLVISNRYPQKEPIAD